MTPSTNATMIAPQERSNFPPSLSFNDGTSGGDFISSWAEYGTQEAWSRGAVPRTRSPASAIQFFGELLPMLKANPPDEDDDIV
eukprot:scaffold37681_cov54-Attheya_sp.AAC.1